MSRRNIKTRRSERPIHLPKELIEEILARLPVKSLLKFRCVSKSWRSLISSKQFIKTQFQNSTKNTSLSHHGVAFLFFSGLKQCSLRSLLNKPSFDPSSLIDVPSLNQKKRFRVLGCCNGLVCLLQNPKTFILWNPATKTSMKLRRLRELEKVVNSKYGFGWDETSDAYKVFVLIKHHGSSSVDAFGKVYNSRTNRWTTVERGAYNRCISGQFVGGRIYWSMAKGDIESFDLETEKFGAIKLPNARWLCFWLREIGGCLAVVGKCNMLDFDVWVMKEYGVKESWLKLVNISLVSVPRDCPFEPMFGGFPNGEILLVYGDTLLVYYPKDDEFSTVKNNVRFFKGCVYVESLVSPDFNNKL